MRILLIDDHELFRNGLRYQVAAIDPTIEIVEAETFTDALHLLSTGQVFDKAFLDVMIPDALSWQDTMREMANFPRPPSVIIMSGFEDPTEMQAAITMGAVGFIPKSLKGDILESALRLVLEGNFCILPHVQGMAIWQKRNSPAVVPEKQKSDVLAPGNRDVTGFCLTVRQQEVLECINAGMSNRQIARMMNLSEATVKMHVGRLFRVLGAQSRTDALAIARQSGYLA